MPHKTKILFNGQQVDASLVPVRSSQEPWSEYILDDGTLIRLRSVVTEVYRIDNMYDPEGNPVYQVKSSNVASAIPSEDSKRK